MSVIHTYSQHNFMIKMVRFNDLKKAKFYELILPIMGLVVVLCYLADISAAVNTGHLQIVM